MEIVMLPPSSLKPYENNARDSEKTIDHLVDSIKKFGFTEPIIVNTDYVIIAGHSRLRAALALGMTEVPCLISDMNLQSQNAFRIADNKIHTFSEWNNEALLSELREIGNLDEMQEHFDMLLGSVYEPSKAISKTQVTQEQIDTVSIDPTINKMAKPMLKCTCENCQKVYYIS